MDLKDLESDAYRLEDDNARILAYYLIEIVKRLDVLNSILTRAKVLG